MLVYVSKLFKLIVERDQLAPVLLATDTHCWQWLCKRPEKSNSTGIRFDLLCWIDSNLFGYRI